MKFKAFNSQYLQDGWDQRLNRYIQPDELRGRGHGNSYAAGTGHGDGNGSGCASACGDTYNSSQSYGQGDGRGKKFTKIKYYEIKEI